MHPSRRASHHPRGQPAGVSCTRRFNRIRGHPPAKARTRPVARLQMVRQPAGRAKRAVDRHAASPPPAGRYARDDRGKPPRRGDVVTEKRVGADFPAMHACPSEMNGASAGKACGRPVRQSCGIGSASRASRRPCSRDPVRSAPRVGGRTSNMLRPPGHRVVEHPVESPATVPDGFTLLYAGQDLRRRQSTARAVVSSAEPRNARRLSVATLVRVARQRDTTTGIAPPGHTADC